MEELFLEIVNRSLTAGVLILIVIVLRACCKKMPKWVRLVLWGFVAVRLICPVTLESNFSLMPDTDNVIEFLGEVNTHRQENTETTGSNDTQNRNPMEDGAEEIQQDQMQSENHIQPLAPEASKEDIPQEDRLVSDFDIQQEQPQVPDTTVQEQPLQNKTGQPSALSVAAILWLVGMLGLCVYSTVKYLRLKQQVRISINETENIFLCDAIDTPFVLGFVSPKIYLPSGLEQETADYAVLHEKEHLRCGDQWWKLLSFLLLVFYWFHPLVWVAYLLVCNDIEYACDERVIKRLEREERKAYTKALLSCSMGHRTMLFCPPSFVRNSVKKRVRSVVSFKKATMPVLCVAVVVCVIVAVTFLTDRRQGGDYAIELNGAELSKKTAEHIAEEIAELMQESEKGIYRLENFSFTFYELESEQENRLLRVSVEADSTLVREPEDSPLIQGMKKAQSELTYEAERTFAQTMIDSMLAQLEADREERICEPVIFVALDEKGNYELVYGDAERTPLEDYFQKENAEQEELLGYLTVYQRAGIQPPMDTVGSSGYVYSRALENPENQVVNYAAYVSGISVNQSFLYYGDSVYDDITAYEVKDKEKLPWALLGDEIKLAYSNNGRYWSERDKLTECTGHGTIYQVKGYEDSYLVALVYARDFPTGMYGMSSWESTPYKQRVFHRDDVLEDGVDPTYCVILCERMNDLWFHEGREVFSKRLHLENAVATNGLSMEEELLWNFLAELNDATFIQPDSTDLPKFSELASQTITFTDAIGVKHSLILYEGGYVVKQACNTRLIAKIEEETCRCVMERIQAYEAEQPVVSSQSSAFAEDEVLKTIKLPMMGEECIFEVLGKKRADLDIYGVREIILYAGGESYQSILVQEAIDADGVDGIDKGYTECPNMEDTVNLKDVNFDGYPDLEVWGWSPNNSIPYYYWCWNPETLQFEYAFCLQLTDVDEERKHLISYTKAGGGVYYMERYRVTRENTLELAERMTEDYRTFMNWQEAYRDVIYNFPDNMADLNNPYATRDTSDWTNAEKYMYLGTLDFDADGTPELLIGDTVSLAVFTFRNGKVEKCTEVILPNGFNKIDDVGFKENAVIVNCYGASAFGYAAVTYRDGKWINATCSNEDGEIFINGEKATSEAWNTVMPFPVDEWGNIEKLGRIPREYRNRVVKEEDGSYVLYTWTKEEGTWYYEYGWTETGVALDATFDFEQLRWTED